MTNPDVFTGWSNNFQQRSWIENQGVADRVVSAIGTYDTTASFIVGNPFSPGNFIAMMATFKRAAGQSGRWPVGDRHVHLDRHRRGRQHCRQS